MSPIKFIIRFMISLVPLTMGLGTRASADQCPNLSGSYSCPAVGGTSAFEMQVKQSGSLRRVVSYGWKYSVLFQPEAYVASVKGFLNPDGSYGLCRNKGLYITKNLNDLSNSLRNEINLKGNYVVTTFMGEPVMTCLRMRR